VLAVRWRRSQPLFTWGVGLLFLMQLPTANLLFPIGSIMGERFLYLPSVGFAVVAAIVLDWLSRFFARQMGLGTRGTCGVAALLAFLVLGTLSVRTHFRNQDWQDDLTIWRSAVQNAPDSFKSYQGYSSTLWAAGLKDFPQDRAKQEAILDQAIALAEIGLRILDNPPLPLPKQSNSLYVDLGNFYLLKGDFLRDHNELMAASLFYQKSLAVLLRAEAVDRWLDRASRQASLERGRPERDIPDVGDYQIYANLEQTYERLNDWDKAEQASRRVELLAPDLGLGYRQCGRDLFNLGKVREAARQLLEAALLDKHDAAAWQSLAACYKFMGLPPEILRLNGSNAVLDINFPDVREDLNAACVALVQQFLDAKQYDTASRLRDKFVEDLRVPMGQFPSFDVTSSHIAPKSR
jgi:tetratricopeptide (TPR) repeat protein